MQDPVGSASEAAGIDVLAVIARRMSVRSYRMDPLSGAQLEQLRDCAESAEALTGAAFQFLTCTDEQLAGEVKGVLGDYGKVIRAPHYIVMCARESRDYMVDAGYRFEQMILEATRRNIGTCWVGGFFREATMQAALGLPRDQRIIALTPVGCPGDATMGSRLIRVFAGSSNRKPVGEMFFWKRHEAPLPGALLDDPAMGRIFEAVRRAPSWANKQPWRFLLSEGEIAIYKQASQMKEDKDYHALDCGIAMAHLQLAARAVGKPGAWKLAEGEIPGAPNAQLIGVFR